MVAFAMVVGNEFSDRISQGIFSKQYHLIQTAPTIEISDTTGLWTRSSERFVSHQVTLRAKRMTAARDPGLAVLGLRLPFSRDGN